MIALNLYSFCRLFRIKKKDLDDEEIENQKNKKMKSDKIKADLLESKKKIKNINYSLKKAIRDKNDKLVEHLFNSNRHLNNLYDEALDHYALNDDLDLVEYLLRHKGVYKIDFHKFLKISVKADNLYIFKYLIEDVEVACEFDEMLLLSVAYKSYNISTYIISILKKN